MTKPPTNLADTASGVSSDQWLEETHTHKRPHRLGSSVALAGAMVADEESELSAPTHPLRSPSRSQAPPALARRDEASVVIVEHGSVWPRWLATELADERDTLVVGQQMYETREALVERSIRRLNRFSRRVTTLLWLVGPEAQAPGALALLTRKLRGQCDIHCAVRHVVTRPHGAPAFYDTLDSDAPPPLQSEDEVAPEDEFGETTVPVAEPSSVRVADPIPPEDEEAVAFRDSVPPAASA